MKKILFVMHSLGFGGAERSLVNLLNELPSDQYQVDVLLFQQKGGFLGQLPGWVNVLETPKALRCLYGPVAKAGKYIPCKVLGTVWARLWRRRKKEQSAFRWRSFYRRRIETLPGHYDVAVAYTGSEILYFVADRVSANRKAVFIHNDYRTAGYSADDDESYLGRMDAIVSISRQCVEVLREEFPQYAGRMHYLENITSSSLVRARAEEYVPEEYQPGVCNILSVGRLWPQKGFDMAIDAAALLKKEGVDFRWHVVGEGSLREELQRQITDRSLEDRFFLLGSRSNPYPYMKGCTLLVQSSRYEGKSVVLDEAKMLCTPIVATDYPTVGDQVSDGREGIITEMSPEGIARGVMRMLREEALRKNVIDYLWAHEYGNQAEVEKYRKLLDEL
ncbi:MAG: glycosyltransferase [Clostridiales bacterium]|nr:glycosyltransferase [Clostridiales bacterium]